MRHRFLFKFPENPTKLTDGRYTKYLGKEVNIDREKLAKVLKRKQLCDYEEITALVDKCRPGEDPMDYFDKLSESEVRAWRKM